MLGPVDRRLDALEAKMEELEAMLTLAFRLLSIEKPVSALLERFGATEAEDVAVHDLLDNLATRLDRGEMYRPSLGGFEGELYERFPGIRGDREFVTLLLDALKLDRPAYRKLHAFVVQEGWNGAERAYPSQP